MTDEPVADDPGAAAPMAGEPASGEPRSDGLQADGLQTDGAQTDGPSTDGPSTDGPSTDGPGSYGPLTDGAGSDGPATTHSGGAGPGSDEATAGGHGTDETRRVDLHIGLMKSGTTFIQQLLTRHRALLAEDGVLFPGADYGRQVAAARDLIDLRGPLTGGDLDGAWSQLQAELAAWPGRAILSVEHLSLARSTQIRALVDSVAPARVRVVITARDMSRVLPSSWQETVQNALTWSWEDFVASVTGAPAAMNAPAKRFWRQHGLIDIVDRWAHELGPDSIRIVTVPPEGAPPGVLWERFCSAVDLDPSRYPVQGSERPVNASLDRDAAELLRRLNLRLGDQLEQAEYVRFVKRPLAKRLLAQLPAARPVRLSDEQLAWAVRHGEHVVAGLQRRDVRVIGDLQELVPQRPGPEPDTGPAAAGADADPADVTPYPAGDDVRAGDERRIADLATAAANALLTDLVAATRGPEHGRRRAAPPVDDTP